MEAAPRFELGNKGFADLCLTTWLCRHMERKTRFELATLALARRCSTTEPLPHIWCPEAESNHRHGDFQSPALPTELSGQNGGRNRARTYDPLLVRQVLSQLSYAPSITYKRYYTHKHLFCQ